MVPRSYELLTYHLKDDTLLNGHQSIDGIIPETIHIHMSLSRWVGGWVGVEMDRVDSPGETDDAFHSRVEEPLRH